MRVDSGGQLSTVSLNVWGIWRTLVHGEKKYVENLKDSCPP